MAELSQALELALRRSFPDEVWVRGQIRNLKRGERMVWFDVVEPGADLSRPPEAKLPVALFDVPRRQVNARLRQAGGAVRMEDGTEVRLRGGLTWWASGGRLQLAMSDIDPEFTLGQLLAERERLIRKLDAEGLLRAQARLPLPEVPQRIGLVTSTGSAAEHDVLDELRASGVGFRVLKADVRVQGRESERQVVAALGRLARAGVDAVLLVRGGGATTDLAAFDSEAMARAIAGLDAPVITGIGHDIDRTLVDEVAHSAHKTPTAAAQALVASVRAFVGRLDTAADRIATSARHRLVVADQRLAGAGASLTRAAGASLVRSSHRLDRASGRVEAGARVHLTAEARRLDSLGDRLSERAPQALAAQERRLAATELQVRAMDPARTLARGWSITRTSDGTTVRSPDQLSPGQDLVTTVADGTIESTVR